MPTKSSAKQRAGKGTRTLRSDEEIQTIMEEIANDRASGATLTEALWQRDIPYNTYNKWTKKFGESKPAVPAAKAASAKPARVSRTEGEIKGILASIAALRNAGATLKDAVAQQGIVMSTYQYWTGRYGKQPAADEPAVVSKAPSQAGESVDVELLQEMLDNRKKRQELEEVAKQIAELDAQYAEFKIRFGA